MSEIKTHFWDTVERVWKAGRSITVTWRGDAVVEIASGAANASVGRPTRDEGPWALAEIRARTPKMSPEQIDERRTRRPAPPVASPAALRPRFGGSPRRGRPAVGRYRSERVFSRDSS